MDENTEPESTPGNQPESLDAVRRQLLFGNATGQIAKRSREDAEEQLRNEMRRGSGWNPLNWPRKIALRVGEEYFRQKFIERAREAKVANNNSFLDIDLVNNVIRDANNQVGQERQELQSKVEQIRTGELIEGQRTETVQGELKEEVINQILRPYINGEISDSTAIQQKLREFVQTHQEDPQVQAIFGHDATDSGRLAEYFATDLAEVAEGIKQDIAAHKYALNQLDKNVDITFANTSWAAETEAHKNAVDKAVAWAQNGRVRGWILNPAVIGAGASLATFGLFRVAGATASASRYVVPGVGMAFGAAVAGARRYHDLNVDRASHQVERAYNRQIPLGGAPRREALEKYAYSTASVDDLSNRLKAAGSDREAVMRAVAEIKTRLDFSSINKVDLITFSSREQVEQGRLQLIKEIIEARQHLRTDGVSDDEIKDLENRFTGDFNQQFIQNREQQDKAFAGFRLRNAAGSAAFAGVAGLASGILVNEGVAAAQRLGGEHPTTFLSAFWKDVGIEQRPTTPTPASASAESVRNLLPNTPIDQTENGHLLVHGDLPPDVRDQLKSDGFQINQLDTGGVDHKAVLGPDGEWTKHSTNVDHREGYDYDQPGSQQNELRLYDAKEGSSVILKMDHMQLGYQKGLVPNPIDVQKVIADHEAGWYFTLPSSPQDGIWVSDGTDGVWDGQLRLDPNDIDPTHIIQTDQGPLQLGEFSKMVLNEQALQQYPDGNLATELYSRQDVFNLGEGNKYGFIEAGRLQDRGGVNVLQHFATIRGLGPIPQTIDIPVPPTIEIIPPEAIPTPEVGDEIPLIPIPFAPRHPLEPLVLPPMVEYPSAYNFGYELFRKPDGTPATMADIIRFRSPRAEIDARLASLFPPRTPREGTSSETAIPEPVASEEGEQALALIHETFINSDHVYLSLSGAIGDVVIDTAYLEGIRQYAEKSGQQKKVTLITPPNIVPLLEPLAQKYGYEIVTQERFKGVEKAVSMINDQKEQNALVLEFEHHTGRPVLDVLPNGGLVVNDLFAASAGLYDNGRSGDAKFAAFFSDLFTIPEAQRFNIKPTIELPENSNQIFEQLKTKYNIDTNKDQVAVVIEASHQMKRYSLQNWQRVLQQLSTERPNTEFNIIFNPTAGTYTQQQLQSILGIVPGVKFVSGNLLETEVLLAHQKLVLSNDTGFAHVAAVLENGPQVISLHIPLFPPNTWVTNTKRHTGLMPQNSQLTNEFKSEETDENQKWINKITPEEVVQNALKILVPQPLQTTPAPPPTETFEARAPIRITRPEPISQQDLEETKGWADRNQLGYIVLENARTQGNEEQLLRGITARVRREEQVINERYQIVAPLSDAGQRGVDWELQSNPGMFTCQLTSAANGLRALGIYDSNRHRDQDFIKSLGGEDYVRTHREGASQTDISRALQNLAPETTSRYSNSFNEIIRAVENGAAAIVPLGPGHVGTIMPGNRVTRSANGTLQVQVLDPLRGPIQIPVDNLIKSDITVAISPNQSPAIVIERRPLVVPTPTLQPTPTPVTPEAPPAQVPGDLLNEANQEITASTTSNVHYETTPAKVIDYLKTIDFPGGAKINQLSARIENNQLVTEGTINALGANSRFTATLATTPSGQLQVISHNIQPALAHRLFIGQVENRIANLNQVITDRLNTQIDLSWEVSGFSIVGDKLAFDFKKK